MLLVNIYHGYYAACGRCKPMEPADFSTTSIFWMSGRSFRPLIFLGVGAMTDFGPLIANPKSFLLGAAAQFGIFAAYLGAMWMGFSDKAAAAISIMRSGRTDIHLPGRKTSADGDIRTNRGCGIFLYVASPDYPAADHESSDDGKERKIKMEQLKACFKGWNESSSRSSLRSWYAQSFLRRLRW